MRTRTAAGALVTTLLSATVLIVGAAPPAGAHATLTGTVPAADEVVDAVPDVVELQFDEPVETVGGAVEVFGPDGERVDLGSVDTDDGGATLRAPIEGDAIGTYTVAWRVTSEDSHTLTGSFVFHNGADTGAVAVDDGGAGATIDVAGGLGRWLGLAGTLTAAGAALIALLLARTGPGTAPGGTGSTDSTRGGDDGGEPLASQGGGGEAPGSPGGTAEATGGEGGTATLTRPVGPPATHGVAPGHGAASARLRTLALAGALAGAAGALLALVAMVAESAGRNLYDAIALVPDLAPDTRTGQLALARIALALAAGAAATVVALWRRSALPVVVLAGAALATWSLAGHAWTAPDRTIAIVSDLVHLGAIALWVGALVPLLVALPLLGSARDRAGLATRFSGLALVAVGAVALSGTVSGWQQVRSVDALTSTGYGQLLLAKVAGFAVLIVLGWANRSRLVPMVERTVAPLQRSLRVEVPVAAAVLALTAALIHEPPARTATVAEPFDTTATADGGAVASATVDPATAGANDIHLYFSGPDGAPLAVDAVQVTAATTDVPPRRLRVTPVTADHVTVAGASLPTAGTWTVEVTAVQAGEPLVFTFEVPIA